MFFLGIPAPSLVTVFKRCNPKYPETWSPQFSSTYLAEKLPAACKLREDFLTGSLKISPQKPTKKKTWHFSMYSSFRIWGTENGEPRCAHHETQARNPQQKNQKIWLEQQNIVFHLPNGNNLSFGHGWMSRLNNLAIFQLEFLWDGGDLSVFLGGEVDGCSFFKHLQSMGETRIMEGIHRDRINA